jgi:hypothetical protein
MIIDGQPAARHGDKCACGATLISSQFVSTSADGGASNPQAASAAQAANAAAQGSSTADSPATQFDDKFILMDDEKGEPLRQTEYAVKRVSGEIEHGTTDDQGHTHLLSATAAAESIYIYA